MRRDLPDLVFSHREARNQAVVAEILTDPLHEFMKAADIAFKVYLDTVEVDIQAAMGQLLPGGEAALRARIMAARPKATWTCLVNEDPFRDALGLHIAGNLGLSLGAAIYSPLYMASALYRRFFKRKKKK